MKTWVTLLLALISPLAHASVSVTVNGAAYTIPQTNEKGWGNNVTTWIQAISSNTLQPTGGNFTLSADIDFGGTNGLKSIYYKTRSSNIAGSGQFRLANGDQVCFRNTGNTADLCLTVGSSDGLLNYNGVALDTVSAAQTLTNKSLSDSTTSWVNVSDASKKIVWSLGGQTTGTTLTLSTAQTTTQTLSVPNVSSGDSIVTNSTTATLSGKTLSAPTITGATTAQEITTPSSPSSGYDAVYFKSDHNLYSKSSGGTETQITPATAANQSANTFNAGPTTGAAAAPTYRTIVSADIPAAAGVVKSITSQIFSTTGSHTYTPNANLLYAIVECVGGGGGGGGTPASGGAQGAAASGGGGGAYTQSLFTAATIGSSQTVTTGAAGSGAAAGQNNGGAGGSSSFGALVTAGGGSGGAASGLSSSGNYGPLASGGAGGTGSGTFRFSIPGQSGGWSWIANAVYIAGDGGNSGGGLGVGGRGLPEASSSLGLAGAGYGGGAGGSSAGASQPAQAGSAGAQGVVIVTEYNSQ